MEKKRTSLCKSEVGCSQWPDPIAFIVTLGFKESYPRDDLYTLATCSPQSPPCATSWPASSSPLLALLSACCPLVVRLLSAFKADNNRTTSGQQADNRATGDLSHPCRMASLCIAAMTQLARGGGAEWDRRVAASGVGSDGRCSVVVVAGHTTGKPVRARLIHADGATAVALSAAPLRVLATACCARK